MATKIMLDEAWRAYERSLTVGDKRQPTTIKRKRTAYNALEATIGRPIQPRHITTMHLDATYDVLGETNSPDSLNVHRSTFRDFFGWCRDRNYIPANHNPANHDAWKSLPTRKFLLGVNEFDDLLETARTPRDRAVMAIGLFLFLRASEIRSLTVGDVDLKAGTINVTVWKTKQRDTMPISEELHEELTEWLEVYAEKVGPLKSSYYLVPGRKFQMARYCSTAKQLVALDEGIEILRPTQKLGKPERIIGHTLRELGYPAIDETTGEVNRQGIHILRRSGARALFDALREEGYSGALQRVRAMLHHTTVTMTEKYLDLDVETDQRNEKFRGQALFPGRARTRKENTGNVIELTSKRAG